MPPGKPRWVNQTLPSGPRVMPDGSELGDEVSATPPASSVIALVSGQKRPMRPGAAPDVNQSAPSPPSAIPVGRWSGVRPSVYSSIVAVGLDARRCAPGSLDSVK